MLCTEHDASKSKQLYRAGINVGPTDRIGLSPAAPVETVAGGAVSAAGAGGGAAAAGPGPALFSTRSRAFGPRGPPLSLPTPPRTVFVPFCSCSALSATPFIR